MQSAQVELLRASRESHEAPSSRVHGQLQQAKKHSALGCSSQETARYSKALRGG